MEQVILAVDKLSKRFYLSKGKIVQALEDISFYLKKEEILGIIGESGSGKSTLARVIAGLEKADNGRVDWLLEWKKPAFLVQMIFQNPYSSLYRGMKVKEILAEPLFLQRIPFTEEKLIQCLEQVNLSSEYLERFPHQLSGGQRQRVALARALILHPSVLIADEPTSMLDMSVQAELLELLLQLKKDNGLSIIFITHNLLVANYLCDRLAIFKDGHLVETGSTEQIMRKPIHSYTKELVQIANQSLL